MLGFVTQRKYDEAVKRSEAALRSVLQEQTLLSIKWNALVKRINVLGGEEFLEKAKIPKDQAPTQAQFTNDELKRLIQLCHPDKHQGSKLSNDMTRKLNLMKVK